ncbi:MAG: T9SS type A sorting domain-containing protein, partial [Bacteroidetes bacterium]|nr:T9SS type A sorting domain-containing protein [Bacteroidota bacterium]
AEADQLNGNLPLDTRGLWGGVILLGNARINTATGIGQIEGIPSTEPRGAFGGQDDEDNSGVMRYVSIRYGGTNIGEGNEINGLTFGGVGSGTTIEYIEVVNNADDGYEWFGGTVNTKYLISAFNGDDSFDYDEGFRGKGQFWFALQAEDTGNRAAEQDGGTTPEDGTPFAIPQLYNATYIGSGMSSTNADNDLAMIFRDNAGGKYFNSIFTDFAAHGISVEDLTSGEDSRARLEAGDLLLRNNYWWNFGAGNTIDAIAQQDFVRAHLTSNSNMIADPQIRHISRTNDGMLDPRPVAGSPVLTAASATPNDGFFTSVPYVGAFGNENWAKGWSFLSTGGVLGIEVAMDNRIPATVELDQNYPNPFNPTTTIRFALPQVSHVRLAVYNAFGQLMDVLLDDVREAGAYGITWSASKLPSGTYFYTLQTANGMQVKKMSLVK